VKSHSGAGAVVAQSMAMSMQRLAEHTLRPGLWGDGNEEGTPDQNVGFLDFFRAALARHPFARWVTIGGTVTGTGRRAYKMLDREG
jgi:hypothetical protein